MMNKVREIAIWGKATGKVIYLCFAIEAIISVVLASVITWSKTYANGASMFQLQTPLFLLGGLLSFCALDSMSLIGRATEREIMKTLLSKDSLFFVKRYLFFGGIFAIFSILVSGLMNINSITNIKFDYYLIFAGLSIFLSLFCAGIITLITILKKSWAGRLMILLLLFQGISIGVVIYPFFVESVNPWLISSIGIFLPIFTAMSLLNSSGTTYHLQILLPLIIDFVMLLIIIFRFRREVKWEIKPLF